MGVEYVHYLSPRPNQFVPTAEQLHNFINELRVGRWILTPDDGCFSSRSMNGIPSTATASGAVMSTVQGKRVAAPYPLSIEVLRSLMAGQLRLEWPINNPVLSMLRYPLAPLDRMPIEEIYYDIGIQWSPQFVYRMSECIDPFEKAMCVCGASVAAEDDLSNPFYASLIHTTCPQCGRPVDVSSWPAVTRDGLTGEPGTVLGGATSRFAFVVDCGKGFPSEGPMHFIPDLVNTFQRIFGCDCYEIGDYY